MYKYIKLGAVLIGLAIVVTMCGCSLPFVGDKEVDNEAAKVESTETTSGNTGILSKTSNETSKVDKSTTINMGGGKPVLECKITKDGTKECTPITGASSTATDSVSAALLLDAINEGKLKVAQEENKWKTYAIIAVSILALIFWLMSSPVDKVSAWLKERKK